MRQQVPDYPGFPSSPLRLSTYSAAHHRSGLSDSLEPGLRGICTPSNTNRVGHVAMAPVSTSPNPFLKNDATRSKGGFHLLAPLACRASPITGTRLQAMPGNRITAVPAPFHGSGGLGGAQITLRHVLRGVAAPCFEGTVDPFATINQAGLIFNTGISIYTVFP